MSRRKPLHFYNTLPPDTGATRLAVLEIVAVLPIYRKRHLRLFPVVANVGAGDNSIMVIGERIKTLREQKGLSQGDIEKRSSLLRCYLSRVENGHTVPSIETLERLALALEVPLYQLFYDSAEPPQLPNLPERTTADEIAWGGTREEARFLNRMGRLLTRLSENDRSMLLHMAQRMVEP